MNDTPEIPEHESEDPLDALKESGDAKYSDHEELIDLASQRGPVKGTEYFAYTDINPGMMYSHALESVREFGFIWVGNTRHYDAVREARISENWFWSPLGILAVVRGKPHDTFMNVCLFFNIIPTVPAVFNELGISGHYEKPRGHSTHQSVFIGDLMLVTNLRNTMKALQDNGTFLNGHWQSIPLPLRYALGHEFLSDEELKVFGERDPDMPRAVRYINRKILEVIGVDYERYR